MKFGVREICDVVFKAKSTVKIGNKLFKKGQPVLYIDTAKTSTTEGAATTVYATGGKGNTRLIAWEGEKTLTFTVEDALLSPMGFAILSGAGLLKGKEDEVVHVHTTSTAYSDEGVIDLTDALGKEEKICETAPIFAVVAEEDGSITGEVLEGLAVDTTGKKLVGDAIAAAKTFFVDFYITKKASAVSELQIDAENFAGYYYVEASTLFRRQNDGVDMPAELTFPNVKIQSNFTFTMASTGDPSTFTFTMDAFPGYTYFNPTRKVLCAMQIIDDTEETVKPDITSVFPHEDGEKIDVSGSDSTNRAGAIADAIDVAMATYESATGSLFTAEDVMEKAKTAGNAKAVAMKIPVPQANVSYEWDGTPEVKAEDPDKEDSVKGKMIITVYPEDKDNKQKATLNIYVKKANG